MIIGSKRKTVMVYTQERTSDGYGGHTIFLKFEQVIHGDLHADVLMDGATQKDPQLKRMTWLKTHRTVTDPLDKIWVINGVEFKVKSAVNNRRRWFYQLEKVGESDAN